MKCFFRIIQSAYNKGERMSAFIVSEENLLELTLSKDEGYTKRP